MTISTFLYIVLLILFMLSIIGVLQSDKYNDVKLLYGSIFIFICSIISAILLWISTIFLTFMTD
jgi:hypothetical protein